MSASIEKKKRVSRKTRAGWSKVDIADVENFQAEQRIEEIEGLVPILLLPIFI